MTVPGKLDSISAEAQLAAFPGSVRPHDASALVVTKPSASVRLINPDDDSVTTEKIGRSAIKVELTKLQIEATQAMRAYVLATIDYVSALGDATDAPAAVTIKIGHFRRQGLSVTERLDDFIESKRHIVSILTERPKHRSLGAPVAPVVRRRENSQSVSANLRKLTPRENQVVELLVKGLPNKQIGYELGISVTTVKAHIGKILQKLNISNRARVIALLANVDSATTARSAGKV